MVRLLTSWTIPVVAIGIWVSLVRGIAVDWGRGIVIDGVSAGSVTRIVLSPMLHEHLSALLSGRRPPGTMTVLGIGMNAEVCSGHQITSNLEIGQSWITGRSGETTQHDILDGVIRH